MKSCLYLYYNINILLFDQKLLPHYLYTVYFIYNIYIPNPLPEVLHSHHIGTFRLLCDPLDGYLVGRRRAVSLGPVIPLHIVPCFLVEGMVRLKEWLDLAASLFWLLLLVHLQTRFYLTDEVLDESLGARCISECGDSRDDETPRVCQYQCIIPWLPLLGILDCLWKGLNQTVLSCWGGWGMGGDP